MQHETNFCQKTMSISEFLTFLTRPIHQNLSRITHNLFNISSHQVTLDKSPPIVTKK